MGTTHNTHVTGGRDVPKGTLPRLSFTKADIWPRFELLLGTTDSKVSSCLRSTVNKSVSSMSALFSLPTISIASPGQPSSSMESTSQAFPCLYTCFRATTEPEDDPAVHTEVGRFDGRDPFPFRKYTSHANKFVWVWVNICLLFILYLACHSMWLCRQSPLGSDFHFLHVYSALFSPMSQFLILIYWYLKDTGWTTSQHKKPWAPRSPSSGRWRW